MTTTPDKQGDKKTKPEADREKRFALYSAIPKGDWQLLTAGFKPPKGLARGTLDEHAKASGLPIVDLENGKIDLGEVVCWIHQLIHDKKHLFTVDGKANPLDRKREAEAIIAARKKIVHGAVSMVEMALNELSEKNVVELDEERKAAMVSNLLVVLCGEQFMAWAFGRRR